MESPVTESPVTEVLTPLAPSQTSHEDSEHTSEPGKSTMVCRHWKSKGWCRLQSNCKFLHPEHKRGIAAPRGCNSGSTNDGGMSKAAVCHGMNTTSDLPGDAPSL